jgi:hypothetical protein
MSFGIGGFGGGGGSASHVTGTLSGQMVTTADHSFGTALQSVGGGGGSGGLNVTGGVTLTASSSAAATIGLGLGGFGGSGGSAGNVDGSITGLYFTTGYNSDAILAQSVGGGGGRGGLNISGGLTVGGGTAGTATIGIGGFGGGGGNAGNVSLTRVGDTRTTGGNSDGIVVQSLGGGGGAGGVNISGGISASTGGSAGNFGFGLGGFGGAGGNAGTATANITGNVFATGFVSDLIGTIQVGDAVLNARLRQGGSHGVVVQSAGGSGGVGALNVTGQISIAQPGSPTITSRSAAMGIGGFGGSGGDAGAVVLSLTAPAIAGVTGTERGQVRAAGDERSAVIAQSLGGGGGVGGIHISGGVALGGTLTTGIGGFGGGGGIAGTVNATVTADLFAAGNRSRGLLAQSVGGGGGYGGINISGGFTLDPAGSNSSLVFDLGGLGGAGNRSSDVTVQQTVNVMVDGVHSAGIVVQSVAGGGGDGGINVSANLNLGSATTSTNPLQGFAFTGGVGGNGGDGADAGNVFLESNGTVIINGAFRSDPQPGEDTLEAVQFTGFSDGIVVQSVGGGGGLGGINVAGAIAPFANPVAVGVGGSGGSGGHGGTVTVVRGYEAGVANPHLVRTFGDNSGAFIAQSIGGGGGRAGVNITTAVAVGGETNKPIAALISVGAMAAARDQGTPFPCVMQAISSRRAMLARACLRNR